MPTTVTESDAYTPSIANPNDGEAANSASLLNNFVQAIVNRTRYFNQRLTSATVSSITPVNAFTSPVQIPDTAALAAPNAFSRIAQPLADQATYLRERIYGASTGFLYQHVLPAPFILSNFNADVQGSVTLGSGWISYIQQSTSGYMYFPLPLAASGNIIRLGFTGRGLSHAGLPANKFKVELLRMNAESAPTILMTCTDEALDAATYDTTHTSEHALTTVTPTYGSSGKPHMIRCIAESGANSVAVGYQLFDVFVAFQAP